jgi:hypothetical protein
MLEFAVGHLSVDRFSTTPDFPCLRNLHASGPHSADRNRGGFDNDFIMANSAKPGRP